MVPISVLVATVGRPSIRLTIESFLAQPRAAADHIYVLGDGWRAEGISDLTADSAVTFTRCKRERNFGHAHLERKWGELSEGYVVLLGDDDMLLPGAFARVRPHLDGRVHSFTSVFWDGRVMKYISRPEHINGDWFVAQSTFTPAAYYPSDLAIYGDLFPLRRAMGALGCVRHDEHTTLFQAPWASEALWKTLGLSAVHPWDESIADALVGKRKFPQLAALVSEEVARGD